MDADYKYSMLQAVAPFSMVVSCTNQKYIEKRRFIANNFSALTTGCRFTTRISNLFLVLHKCNIWIYFLLLLTQVEFFGTTFYFLESRKFSHYFYFLKSKIFGKYFYFLESSKVIYFWQHDYLVTLSGASVMCYCCCSWQNYVYKRNKSSPSSSDCVRSTSTADADSFSL